LKANGNALASLTSDDYSDLQFLKEKIGSRRLVQLGESGHGVAEFNDIKVRLIKFLHQEMGFEVIAFESGFYECFQADRGADSLSAEQFMYECPFGVWHTWEVIPLFEYIKSTQATERPLILAGFDTQRSSWLGNRNRADFLEGVIEPVDPGLAQEVRVLEGVFDSLYAAEGGWIENLANHADTLRSQYEAVLEFFDSHEGELKLTFADDPLTPLAARQTIWTILRRIDLAETRRIGECSYTEVRDEGMAGNVSYLARTMYPDKKIIIWAHNFHIRHDNLAVSNSGGCRTMGGWVVNDHRAELYTVGLYMHDGFAAMNNRTTYMISPPPEGSLEAYLNQAGHDYFFLDFLSVERATAPDWIFKTILARSWGTNHLYMVPSAQYDAVLFIRTVNPPDYT
jgi:erythromycin esterase